VPTDRAEESDISFGPFRLVSSARLLEKNGVPIQIGGRALDILICLAERPGEIVTKRELLKRVWADVNVDEGSLRFHIAGLRKSIGDGAPGARYLVTVPGRGYFFAVPTAGADPPAVARESEDGPAPRSLPAPLARMIGRADTVDKISVEIETHRFVVIVGPGGIGKTTVAIAVGQRQLAAFENAVFFVDFGALRDARLVPSAIARVLGLTVGSDDPVPGILAFLRNRRALLILDSCEHVLEALAPLTEKMVGEAPELRILATSRESFRIESENVRRLFPLDCPPRGVGLKAADVLGYPAAQLFVERVAASLDEFKLNDDEAALIVEICAKLDGIALAIELAAGKVSAHGIAGVASLLNSRFSLLWQGRRTAVPRHQTLGAALRWSYDLLPAAESTVLRRLSVFVGPFTLDAAVAVVSDEDMSAQEVIEAIANLTAKSLIAAPSAGRPSRYRLLDTTRAFTTEVLAASGEANGVARAHAAYFVDLLADDLADTDSVPAVGGSLHHEEHLANVLAALDWSLSERGDRRIGVDLAAVAACLFLDLSLLTECRRWARRALASLEGEEIGSRKEMELQAALGVSVMFTKGNAEEVRSAFTRSLALAQTFEDSPWQAWLLRGLHIYLTRIGDFHGALRIGEQGSSVAKASNDRASALKADWMLGVAHHLIGNQRQAVRFCESAMTQSSSSKRLDIFRIGYDDRTIALVALARGLWLTGRPDRAVEVARYTIAEAERLEQPLTLGISLVWTIYVFLWIGDWVGAESLIERLIDHATRHFLGPYQGVGIGQKGELLIRRGDVVSGIEHLRRSQATLYETGHRIMTTVFATALSEGLASLGHHEAALRMIDDAIGQLGEDGESFDLPDMLRARGNALGLSGRLDEAESCLLRSLGLARHQSALGWELRSGLTLARLWRENGRQDEARALIAPLYARYAEGLDTVDLVAAKAVLDAANRKPRR
jgi:predicted ATPase/DNA-binding winged helix-turn-helix (wHTH) protein